jgi:hypothetical protein
VNRSHLTMLTASMLALFARSMAAVVVCPLTQAYIKAVHPSFEIERKRGDKGWKIEERG